MRLEEFDYELPKELIAQMPEQHRDECRLMVLDRNNHTIEHRHFYDIKDYLRSGDCLVVNDSRVIPARMHGRKAVTGAKIELLLIKRLDGDVWECMVRPGKRLHEGDRVEFGCDEGKMFEAHVLGMADEANGMRAVEFLYDGIFMERLEELGSMPLPPYIERSANKDDSETYQTVYSKELGSVAAPTAGLHFTEELLQEIKYMGVDYAEVTLHVGIGTFRPVKVDIVEEHKMHFEEYSITEENAEIINKAIREGRRIISVGTTSTRTLESAAITRQEAAKMGIEVADKDLSSELKVNGCHVAKEYYVKPGSGSTGIFIYPGYNYKIVDALITNFHLPKSTLIMLISAFYDKDKILEAYAEAVSEKYRFFSYGDAMLIK